MAESCRADIDPAVILAGKRTTAFLEIGNGTASAVCVEKPGLFVTCAHVISDAKDGKVKLVLNAGEEDQKVVTAQVIRVDDEHDLETLKIPAGSSPAPLKLGSDETLAETLEVVGFGYPFGKNLPGAGKDGFPTVSVNLGRVTSVRRKKGRVEMIQLDVVLNPGNSGGPVVDRTGKLMGVVQSGLRGAGINFAVPAGEVRTFLEAPTVNFAPPQLASSDRGKTLSWPIEVVSALDLPAGATFEVEIGPPNKAKVVPARPIGNGRFTGDVVPLPADSPTQAQPIRF